MTIPQLEKAADVGAVGAIVSPIWLPHLHDVSTWAGELAPVLGCVWLILQIVHKIFFRAV